MLCTPLRAKCKQIDAATSDHGSVVGTANTHHSTASHISPHNTLHRRLSQRRISFLNRWTILSHRRLQLITSPTPPLNPISTQLFAQLDDYVCLNRQGSTFHPVSQEDLSSSRSEWWCLQSIFSSSVSFVSLSLIRVKSEPCEMSMIEATLDVPTTHMFTNHLPQNQTIQRMLHYDRH